MGNKASSVAALPANKKSKSPHTATSNAADAAAYTHRYPTKATATAPGGAADARHRPHLLPGDATSVKDSLGKGSPTPHKASLQYAFHTMNAKGDSVGGISSDGGRGTPQRNPFTPLTSVKGPLQEVLYSGAAGGSDGPHSGGGGGGGGDNRNGADGTQSNNDKRPQQLHKNGKGTERKSPQWGGHAGMAHRASSGSKPPTCDPSRLLSPDGAEENAIDAGSKAAAGGGAGMSALQPPQRRVSTTSSSIFTGVRQNPFQKRNSFGSEDTTPQPLPLAASTVGSGNAGGGGGVSGGCSRAYAGGECSESALSDITVSEMSATLPNDPFTRTSLSAGLDGSGTGQVSHAPPGIGYGSPIGLVSGGVGYGGGGSTFLSRGEDLEQQRQQAPLSIEEDLFIYDDIVISKDEARTKHWRLAGRKPLPMNITAAGGTGTHAAGEAGAASTSPALSGGATATVAAGGGSGATATVGRPSSATGGSKRLSTGKSFFSFNDFDVCVDEMDLAPSSTSAANAIAAYQRELTSSSMLAELTDPVLGGGAALLELAEGGTGSASTVVASSGGASAKGAPGSTNAGASGAPAAVATGGNGSAAGAAAGGTAATAGLTLPSGFGEASLVNLISRRQQKRILNASMSMSVINTVAAAPNTARVYEEKRKVEAPTANRPLKKFATEALLGHATRVKCIALAPDERELASCSNEDASVALSNLGVRDEVGIFTGHQDTVINVAFSPDGKYLATTSKDRTMILWDVMTTKQLLTFSHAKVVICCCFAPDSKYVVSGCQDRICRLWDTRRGKEWLTYTHHDAIIISVAFSPCGGYVCSASADKTLRVWSSTTAKTRFTLTGHVGIILSCSYTGDGKYIISNDESLLRVWSTADGSCTLSLAAASVAGSTHLAPKGPKLGWTLSCAAPGAFTGYLCVACNNRFVYVLDRKTGKEVASTFCKAPVYCLTSGTAEVMACGDSFGNIYMLRMQ